MIIENWPSRLEYPPPNFWYEVSSYVHTGRRYVFELRGGQRIAGTLWARGNEYIQVMPAQAKEPTFVSTADLAAIRPVSSDADL